MKTSIQYLNKELLRRLVLQGYVFPKDACSHWRRKLLKVRGATLLNWNDFVLQKLQSYGEALNLRGAMAPVAPLFPPSMHVPHTHITIKLTGYKSQWYMCPREICFPWISLLRLNLSLLSDSASISWHAWIG